MEISSKNIDDVYINFKTMLPTNNRSSITLCHFQFGFQGMFDPRLEKNEEGLYDAPHIELIWMMNTGILVKLRPISYRLYYIGYICWCPFLYSKNSPIPTKKLPTSLLPI